MNRKKVFSWVGLVFSLLWLSFIGGQEQQKLVEEVDVVNAMVPVRVFYKNEPVKGLKKEDFHLYVNGKEAQIQGFFEERQKIALEPGENQPPVAAQKPRLFVLIFSINDYNINLTRQVDLLFQKVLRPDDRLILVSNNYFLNDHTVTDLKKERERLIKILEVETHRVRQDLQRVELDLKTLVDEVENMSIGGIPTVVVKDFCTKYLKIFADYKARYANLKSTQSVRMANYLKEQEARKWVIYFHQIGVFPQMKAAYDQRGGTLNQVFDEWSRQYPWVRAELASLQSRLVSSDGDMVNEISKYFLNTETTFHTLLMKGVNTVFLDYFDYKPVSDNSESIMRKVTQLTGGETLSSAQIDRFVDKISVKEDVYYVLTYIPGKDSSEKSTIKVTVNDQGYQVIYDDRNRPRSMKRALEKIAREEIPQIRVNNISYNEGILEVSFSGIKIGMVDNEKRGKILLKIKILNEKSEILSHIEKAFKCKEDKFVLRVKPPVIGKGKYDIIVEVEDLLTGKNDVSIKEVRR